MLILDTNHFSEIERGSRLGAALMRRLDEAGLPVATTIVTAEEQIRGRLASIKRAKTPLQHIETYGRLQSLLEHLNKWLVLPFDSAAATRCDALRKAGVRTSTMDLRIASIALSYSARLLSRNFSDFELVPGLQVEDWL